MPTVLDEIAFGAIKERYDAFWRREVPGRPLVSIACPRADPEPRSFPVPDTPQGRWTDIRYQCDRARYQARNTVWLGDAFPMFLPNIGPDSFSAYLGAELDFLDDATSWVRPFVEDLAEYDPVLDPANRWWRYMCDLLDALCESCGGDYVIGIPDLHGGGDSLAAVRHPDRLALDLFDRPGEVTRLMATLARIYRQVFDDYIARLGRVQDGSSTWLTAYSRGTYTALQNDFSGLVSPDMFVEFFLPEIVELAGYLDNSIYHLDGPSALGNLPHLLGVDALDGIQWVPGAGAKPMTEWIGVCREVLEAGKCLHVSAPADEVPLLLEQLPHEGLAVCTWCGDAARGRGLLEDVERRFSQ